MYLLKCARYVLSNVLNIFKLLKIYLFLIGSLFLVLSDCNLFGNQISFAIEPNTYANNIKYFKKVFDGLNTSVDDNVNVTFDSSINSNFEINKDSVPLNLLHRLNKFSECTNWNYKQK